MSFMKLFLLLIYIFLTGDCHDSVGRKNRCVTGAIYNYTMQLKSGYQDSISVEKCKLITNGYYIFRCYNITFPILNGNNMGCFPLLIIDNLTEALMFLSHFIGDVHQVCSFYWEIETHTVIHFSFKFLFLCQPLHVGFIGDEGGNTITVRWYRRKTNLHHVRCL